MLFFFAQKIIKQKIVNKINSLSEQNGFSLFSGEAVVMIAAFSCHSLLRQ